MIDIHCHILHGLDDGAKDMEESIEMARIAYEDGIRHIVATPHFTFDWLNERKTVVQRTEILQQTLDKLDIPITIYPANEIRIEHPGFVYDHFREHRFGLIGNKHQFVLLEQSWKKYEPESGEIMRWFMDQNIRPIIPHPERHHFFRDTPELLYELIELGAWIQVTVDSMLGTNGAEAYRFARELAKEDRIHLLATDAHNVRRKPNLSEGFRLIAEWCGEKRAQEIRDRAEQIIE